MLPRKQFWNFTCCNGHFSAFRIIFTQILFKFFDPECFAKYDALCLLIFGYVCLRRMAYRYWRASKLWQNCIQQKRFWKWLLGGCIVSIPLILPPGFAPGHKQQKLSKEYGIFQSLSTVSLILFFFTKRQSQKGVGGMAQWLSLNTLLCTEHVNILIKTQNIFSLLNVTLPIAPFEYFRPSKS